VGGVTRRRRAPRAVSGRAARRIAAGRLALQRPELWNLNGRMHVGGERAGLPLSNWTELDVWQYIRAERVALPDLYFAHPGGRASCATDCCSPFSPFVRIDSRREVQEGRSVSAPWAT